MSGLSLMMEMSGQRVLIGGAGAAGLSKAAKCAAHGADVLMLSPDPPACSTVFEKIEVIRLSVAQAAAAFDAADLVDLYASFERPVDGTDPAGRIFWAGIQLSEAWLAAREALWWQSFLMVIPATVCSAVNRAMMRHAAEAGCLVIPAAGEPEAAPSLGCRETERPVRLARFTSEIRRGPVTVSVSCGQAPALAQRFRVQLESDIPDWWGISAERLAEWRQCDRLKHLPRPQRRMLIRRLADLLMAHRGDPAAAAAELDRALTVAESPSPERMMPASANETEPQQAVPAGADLN